MSDNGQSMELQTQLDLLVDGELTTDETQALLDSLDLLDHGWKQCALTLLEAQSWRQSFDELRAPALQSGAASVSAPHPAAKERRRPLGRQPSIVWLVLGMAATLFLALGLGGWLGQHEIGAPPLEPQPASTTPRDQFASADTPAAAAQGESNATSFEVSADALGQVTFVMNSEGGNQRQVQLPVYSVEDIEPALENLNQVLSPDMAQAFHQMGYEMEPHIKWTPLPLGGQRQVYFPVGRAKLTPVTYRSVQ